MQQKVSIDEYNKYLEWKEEYTESKQKEKYESDYKQYQSSFEYDGSQVVDEIVKELFNLTQLVNKLNRKLDINITEFNNICKQL